MATATIDTIEEMAMTSLKDRRSAWNGATLLDEFFRESESLKVKDGRFMVTWAGDEKPVPISDEKIVKCFIRKQIDVTYQKKGHLPVIRPRTNSKVKAHKRENGAFWLERSIISIEASEIDKHVDIEEVWDEWTKAIPGHTATTTSPTTASPTDPPTDAPTTSPTEEVDNKKKKKKNKNKDKDKNPGTAQSGEKRAAQPNDSEQPRARVRLVYSGEDQTPVEVRVKKDEFEINIL